MIGFRYDWDDVRLRHPSEIEGSESCTALNIDLSYNESIQPIDLTRFKKLEWLGCSFKEVIHLESQTQLYSLVLYNYSKKSSGLEKLDNLKELVLRQCSIENLNFIRNFSLLECLELSYLYKLKDVNDLVNCTVLKFLEIEACKNIDNIVETLVQIKTLKVLKLIGFKLKDLEWVKELPMLEQLIITNTNVLNGDISPAAHIDYVAIDNKRHYNYKFSRDIMNIVKKEG